MLAKFAMSIKGLEFRSVFILSKIAFYVIFDISTLNSQWDLY